MQEFRTKVVEHQLKPLPSWHNRILQPRKEANTILLQIEFEQHPCQKHTDCSEQY